MKKEKIKVIIDTDPGVDDAACLIFALFDKGLDIKLITTVSGNVKIETGTRNVLHILDRFNLDVPVARGAEKAMFRTSPHAEHIHQVEGMGGYNPPKTTTRQVIDMEACEAMYKVLSEGDGDIIPLVLGPQTNIGYLLSRHPDIIKKIPKIVFMGGSPFGLEGYPEYISFNISSDPEAFKYTLDSKIPLVMIPSNIGRNRAHLTQEYVYNMKGVNDVGKMLFEMYDKYWEPGYPDKRIATNDSCAYLYIIAPELFETQKVDIEVDLTEKPGKTTVRNNENGQVDVVVGVDREAFLTLLDEKLKAFNDVKLN